MCALLSFILFFTIVIADNDFEVNKNKLGPPFERRAPPRVWNTHESQTLNFTLEYKSGHPYKARMKEEHDSSTFVLIAAYRESRCGRTICDMFDKAKHPQNVGAGIADQLAPEDESCVQQAMKLCGDKYGDVIKSNVHVAYMNVSEAKGPCIARARAHTLLPAEEEDLPDFCLQVDSHVLFVRDWDIHLMREWASVDNEYGVLSTYAAKIQDMNEQHTWQLPDDVPHLCRTMWGGHGLVRNTVAASAYFLPRPKLTNLWGAGLSYAKCHFERNVPYDPHLYHIFDGEEYSRMARMWTSGYDSYTPTRNLVFHDYKHVQHFWSSDVNRDPAGRKVDVPGESSSAAARLKTLLQYHEANRNIDLGAYGLGNCRSFAQLQNFTGVYTNTNPRKESDAPSCGQLSWVPFDEKPCMKANQERVALMWDSRGRHVKHSHVIGKQRAPEFKETAVTQSKQSSVVTQPEDAEMKQLAEGEVVDIVPTVPLLVHDASLLRRPNNRHEHVQHVSSMLLFDAGLLVIASVLLLYCFTYRSSRRKMNAAENNPSYRIRKNRQKMEQFSMV